MYLVTRQILPLMANDGRIVNLSSVLGRFGVPGYTAYCASKHGVIGFTRALAFETLKKRITVNAIAPGWVDTDMATLGMSQGATHAKVSLSGASRLWAGMTTESLRDFGTGRVRQPGRGADFDRAIEAKPSKRPQVPCHRMREAGSRQARSRK